jgi:hypothetical protein
MMRGPEFWWVCAAGIGAAFLGLSGLLLRAARFGGPRLPCAALFTFGACLPVGLAWFGKATPDQPDVPLSRPAVPLDPLAAPLALTDKGRRVPLYAPRANPEERLPAVETESRMIDTYFPGQRILRTGPADLRYNCHGWVFADGDVWVQDDDVPMILEDNGYRPVRGPARGDLALWVVPGGRIIHSGVVREVTEAGVILIEGKWGETGRYLHTADAQPYGSEVHFARSDRKGHRLAGLAEKR